MTESVFSATEPMEIGPELAARVQEELGENVYLCYQCAKCASGCPVGEFFDWQPHQIMRALQLGQEDIALESDTPWLCASCEACTTRCPQGLDITRIMDFLTREALERGIEPRVPEVRAFNEAFLREVRIWRRSYEPGMMAEMKLRLPKHLLDDLDLYLKMFQKGKVSLLPEVARPRRDVKPSSQAIDGVAYYPGCSLHSTAPEFDISTRAVCKTLDLNLVEPDNWVCCGSSAAHRADPKQAVMLPMTNLAQIERLGFSEVTMPCAACFNRHKAALHEIRQDEDGRVEIDEELGYEYHDRLQVNTLIDTLLEQVGLERIAARVGKPLTDLPVVCYYGCLLTRPPDVTEADHPENPTNMDDLMRALGTEVLDWSYKTTCCGAAHSLTRPDIVLQLSGDLVDHASEVGAEAIVVACPLCHTNLDARQFQMEVERPLPVLYFTQLMALAFDLPPEEAAFHRNLVDPRPLLRRYGILGDNGGASSSDKPASERESVLAEDEPASPLQRARAPPVSGEVIPRADEYEDIFDALDRAWEEISRRYDVIGERPAFQQLFEGANLDPPEAAAEAVIAGMLLEVIDRVDRFSPWYTHPAKAYGVASRRDPEANRLSWGLTRDGLNYWRAQMQDLSAAIRRDRGLVLAGLYVERLDESDPEKSGLVEAMCACSPPRRILVPASLIVSQQVFCEECGRAFQRATGDDNCGNKPPTLDC